MRVVVSASSGLSLINFRGNLIKDIVRQGHQVFCLSCENDKDIRRKVEELGASYRCVFMTRTGTNPIADLKTLIAYVRVLREIQPDMYFAYMSKPVAYGGLAAKWCGIPKINILVSGLEIAFYSNGIKNLPVRSILKFFFKKVHKASENIFFQNSDDYQRFLDIGIVKESQSTIVNGSGVDMYYFSKKKLPQEPVVLMIARLVWSKGIREFLDAVSRIKEKSPQTEVLLVGGLDHNPEALTEQELQQCIKKNNIEYCGHVDDVRPYLERCSIFVLPSYHEGTPRSVLEAMATGRPIITTNAPGCRETVIDGYNGYLVPVKDTDILYQRLITLIENKELRKKMAANSYTLCWEKYDVNLVNQVMIQKMDLVNYEGN